MITLRKIHHHQEVRISLVFAFDYRIMNQIKTIVGRQWSPILRCWHIPYTNQAYKAFKKLKLSYQVDETGTTAPSRAKSEHDGIAASAVIATIPVETKDVHIPRLEQKQLLVRWKNNRFFVAIKYHEADVAFLKSLKGSWWNTKYKQWVVKGNMKNLDALNSRYSCFDNATYLKLSELILIHQSPVTLELYQSPEFPEQLVIRLKGYQADVSFLKSISSRSYDPALKRWMIPYGKKMIERIIEHYEQQGATIINRLPKKQSTYMRKQEKIVDWMERILVKLPSSYRATTRSFMDAMIRQSYSRSTVRNYVAKLSRFMDFCKTSDLSKLNASDANAFLTKLAKEGHSNSLLNMVYSAIKLYYDKVAFVQGFDLNRMKRPRKGTYLPSILSVGEVERMLASTSNLKHLSVLYMLYGGGLRRAELLNLRVQDIFWERNQVLVKAGKGKKDRMVMLSKTLKALLTCYFDEYQPEYWLLEGQTKQQYSASSVGAVVKQAASKAGIRSRVTPHTLRHCFATHLMDGGLDSRYIQKLLGHQNIKTTLIYTHVTNRSLNRIVSPLDQLILKKNDEKS